MVSAGTPVTGATRSGVTSATAAVTASIPSTKSAARPGRARPSELITWSIAASSHTSVPGTTGTCSSATSAVSVRRGSITTTRPPRARSAARRPFMSGAVMIEPLLTTGLPPTTSR